MSRKTPKLIYETATSLYVFLFPVISSLVLFYYMAVKLVPEGNTPMIIVLLCGAFVLFLPPMTRYFGNRLFISEEKIYVYLNNKKFISWDLIDDFKYMEFNQSFLGKIFDYGSLMLVNQQNQMYVYKYIKKPKKTYSMIIFAHEKIIKDQDPDYISIYDRKSETTEKKTD